MTEKKIITENDSNEFDLDPRVKERINQYKSENNLENHQINILDWGCGRGKEVLWLREHGYQAFGIDTYKKIIKKNLPFFESRGYDSRVLQAISEDNKTNFPDGFFDIILSNQVFEHIKNIESAIEEMNRITKKNGIGYHRFPAHRKIKEVHLKMPFVHWLPKNRLRKFFITLFVLIGLEPKWLSLNGKPMMKKADTYYQYSVQHTFYRKISKLKDIGKKSGFEVTFDQHINPKISNRKFLKDLLAIPVFKKIIKILFNRFRRVELILVKKS